MGCDIHFHIELKINGRWEHYAHPKVDRWYRLFGLLAGVRNMEETPIAYPKSLPDDVSIITKMHRNHMGCDGHTESWLDAGEILELSEKLHEWEVEERVKWPGYDLEHFVLRTYLFENSFAGHMKYDDCSLPDGIEDVRFVFWFDN